MAGVRVSALGAKENVLRLVMDKISRRGGKVKGDSHEGTEEKLETCHRRPEQTSQGVRG